MNVNAPSALAKSGEYITAAGKDEALPKDSNAINFNESHSFILEEGNALQIK